jgi:toxin ParE1/3/4
MAEYRLSKRAYADIVGIGDYTIERFGIEQARRYRDRLEDAFQALADHPGRGRPADDVAPGLRRWNYQSHAVFFRLESRGIDCARAASGDGRRASPNEGRLSRLYEMQFCATMSS